MLRLLFVLAVSTGVVRGSGDAHGTFEWAGTFDVTAFDKVFWSAQSNEDGIYPDASMAIAVLVGNSDFSLTEELEHEGEEALADPDSCNPLAPFAPLPISEHEDTSRRLATRCSSRATRLDRAMMRCAKPLSTRSSTKLTPSVSSASLSSGSTLRTSLSVRSAAVPRALHDPIRHAQPRLSR